MHQRDLLLLKQIQEFFNGIGTITLNNNRNSAVFRVIKLNDITNVIIPHFDKYPLLTNKRADFLLFKSVVELIDKKEHTTIEGLNKIVSIKASINWGLSEALKESFPKITPIERPEVEETENINPIWLSGFTEGGGLFWLFYSKI